MTEVPPADQAQAEAPSRERGARRAAIRRWTKRGVLVVAAIVAVVVVTFFSVDLGRITVGGYSLKRVAEREGTKFLKRPLHIGRISALVWDGAFAFDDVVIEGPQADLRPFFAAKRITVQIPWWNLLRRDLYLDVTLRNWRMVVENWPDGAHLPNLKTKGGGGPSTIKQRYVAVYARDGEFIFDDHVNNWSVIAPNLNFALVRATNLGTFVGMAEFSDGRTQIQKYQPMKTKFKTWFQLSGGTVKLRHIDLETDGMKSHVNGFVNFGRWPEQEYRITSEVDFPTMKRLFFEKEPWRLTGQGQFAGIFKFFKDGRDLSGTFSSDEAGLGIGTSEWRFPKLHGALSWTPKSFVISHADSEFLGGSMRLNYSLAPLGTKEGANATLGATYQDVDLYRFTRQVGFTSLEPQGAMRGKVSMGWHNGKFSETMQGTGDTMIVAPRGSPTASAALPPGAPAIEPEPGEFQKNRSLGPFALAGDMRYRFSASTLDFDPGWASTPSTYVSFSGHARGNPVNVPFHVTSHDWQKSDRLFAAIMNNFNSNSQMGAIEVGGRGTFDGVLTKEFKAPRIEGRFAGEHMRAFKVLWGAGSGDIVVENNYLHLTNGRVEYGADGGRVIIPSGRFALGYPRADGGEEINASIRVENMPMRPLKEAFTLTDWPVEGTVELAEMTLTGRYEKPAGAGQMKIVNGTAWEEPFDIVSGRLDFKGDGSLEVNEMKMAKSGGEMRGNAVVDWADNTYGFHAETEGAGIPMQALRNFEVEQAPLTGQLTFVADGAGSFDAPTWTITGNIQDLYAGDEGIGPVRARLTMAGDVLRIEELVADSDRLHVFGGGTIRMNETRDANLTFTVANTSIDPYLKYIAREFPYSKAVVGGTVTAIGPLAVPAELSVKVTATTVNLTLFAHLIQNEGDLVLSFDKNVFTLDRVRLKGVDTSLVMSGTVDATRRVSDLKANGQASLAVISAFYPALNAQGEATVEATLTGSLDNPSLLGQAVITGGRLRHEAMPQSFSNIKGPIVMTAGRISIEGLQGSLGEGDVQFFGGIRLDGFQPVEYDLRAEGTGMTLRYPEGLTSGVNANLALTGPLASPLLSGNVDVYHANYSMRVDPTRGYLGFVAGGTGTGDPGVGLPTAPSETPIALDIRVNSDILPFIENKNATISGSADVQIAGTLDRPIVTGRVDLDRGNWVFGGNRYRLQSGSIDFSNPAQLEPFFDIAAFTRVQTTGQSYEITLRLSGSLRAGLKFNVNSDPFLPEFQIISLLLGETGDVSTAELRARSAPQEQQNAAISAAALVFLTSPISSTVGSVVERATFIDTVQIVPLLGSDTTLQQNPTARVMLGQRISSRLYLTYARTLTGRQTDINEIILVEFDQNDQISWILSRNEDRSFGLDFRIKYKFQMTIRIRAALAVLTVAIAAARPAPAAAQDRIESYAGRTITGVELRIEGKPETSAALLALIDIKPGERLAIEGWRRVAARFMQLPRFQNVTVFVEDQPSGVRLVFELEPSHPIDKLEFPGEPGLSPADLENAVRDQFGGLPSLEQRNDVEDTVRRFLLNEGFRSVQVNATVVPTHDPDRATLVVHVTAGQRSMLASLPPIRGTSSLSRQDVLAKLGLQVGQPFRPRALLVEEAKLRASLRGQGFYTASVQHQAQFSEDGSQVDLVLTVNAGPKVRLVVDGDLPGKQEEFIAVDREGSVDADILDASRDAITKALKRDGYWKAQVTYVQEQPSPAEMVITFRIDRGKRYRVDRLDLPSGLHLTAEDMKGLVGLQPRAWFSEEAVNGSLNQIRRLYALRGYHKVTLDPKYQDVENGSADEGGVVIAPNITEGPRADVVAVTFDLGDAPQVPATDLLAVMLLKEGVPFVPAFVPGDRDRLQEHYESLGYLNATVRVVPTLNAEDTAATLAVLAREGQKVVVGEITVVGYKEWSPDDILSELPLKKGMPYSEAARLQSQSRLSDLEFRNVRVSVEPRLPGESQVRIVVFVEESGAVTVAWGGGGEVGTRPRVDETGQVRDVLEVAPRAFIELGRRNFGGRNRSINFFGRVGLKRRSSIDEQTQESSGGFTEYRVTGAYRERHLFRTEADLLAGITFEQAARTNYSYLRRAFNADLLRPLTARTSISGRYTWEFTRVFDNILPPEDQSLIDRLFPQVQLSILSGTLFWNGRTTQGRGHQLSTSIDFALPGLGSEVGFVKNFSQASTVRELGKSGKYALALRAQLGLAQGFERDVPRVDPDGNPVTDDDGNQITDLIDDLPASHRFYAGGSATVRGFQYDQLGVQEILNDDGLSDGGNGLVVFNAEIRARAGKLFGRNLGVVGFVDAGNVFDRTGDIDLKRLRPTAGFGLRYDSWIGPLRLDFGYKLDTYVFRNKKEKRWEFYLSLGEIF